MARDSIMDLWKKETIGGGARYVDLFGSLRKDKHLNLELDLHVAMLNGEQYHKDNQRSTKFRKRGNGLFRLNDWDNAMACYNQSLCFAEIGSENVALAYANRSACWFHLQKYKFALIDIEFAKNSNLPDRLKPKLEKRKQSSLNLRQLGESINMPRLLSKWELSYKANENFPCMADALEVRCNDVFGRHLVAKCDVPVGKIVLSEDIFITSLPYKAMICEMLCHGCLQPYTNPVACTDCSSALFCSVTCFDQNQTHKWECGTFFNRLDDTRFVIQTILVAMECLGSVEDLMEFVETALLEDAMTLPESLLDARSKYHFFFKLKALPPPWDSETNLKFLFKIYKQILNMPKIAAAFDTEVKKRFLMHLIGHHRYIRNANGQTVYKGESIIGQGETITNVASIINHSCAPNIFDYNIDQKKLFVTCRPIKKDEQLLVSYLELDKSKTVQQRQNLLKFGWNFNCKCERCNPTNTPIDRQIIVSDPCYKYVVENRKSIGKNSILMENCIEFLNKYGHSQWSDELQFMVETYEAIVQLN